MTTFKWVKSLENESGLSHNFNNDETILVQCEFDSIINDDVYNVDDTFSLAYINVCCLKSTCSAYEFEETLNLFDIICV